MQFSLNKNNLSLALVISCASLLSACGGDNDKKDSDKSPIPSSSSKAALSSSSSLSSSIASSAAVSSTAVTSSAVSSSSAASSLARFTPPVAWVDTAINSADGNYLVAKGEILLALPEDASNTSFKPQWTGRDGFALYTFAKDTNGVSNCAGNCLANWPPLLAGAKDTASLPYTIIERSLGNGVTARQWAYQGLPLYFFKTDTAAGQTTGKAIANWQLARPIPVGTQQHATKGEYLIGKGFLVNSQGTADQSKAGFTLYTFAKDTANQSNCGATCIANWPPLYAAAEAQTAGDFSVVTRSDNTKQWAFKGQPLYFYAGDSAAGEIKGEIPNWSLAKPLEAQTGNTPTASASSQASSVLTSSVPASSTVASYSYTSSSSGYSY